MEFFAINDAKPDSPVWPKSGKLMSEEKRVQKPKNDFSEVSDLIKKKSLKLWA